MSKFYLEGFSGRVGATWMTREDRLTEIVNQQAYVDQVLSSIDIDWASVQLNYFGFSQGVATMVRYAAYAQIPFAQMVVWAGTFPPEPMSDAFAFLSGQESISYFSGKDDPFYKPEMEEQQRETIYKASGITPKVVFFEGKHEVKSELVSQL
ncbi:alpha/beta hydrolase [Marinoscillum furvescens]|uniref:alpha/beta hydrolase n=1 Tax=Marinoscillum furvescens TaxID=1026 RepID=UPI0011C02B48|nr:phospholipase [Marinoscillum furvescens]